jgi:glycerate kinase
MPIKIIIAPQAFKGGLGAMEAALAMQEGVLRALPDADTALIPVADGGGGTLEAMVGEALVGSGGRYSESRVAGPLGEQVTAKWGIIAGGRTAVIEMAQASGLVLVPEGKRDPRLASSYGTGELIAAALDEGYREIIVGLGGSATNDGGAGMAQALGASFTDASGTELPRGGAALARLEHIDLSNLDRRLMGASVLAATDVTNSLCGPEGASTVYGPQKGATPDIVTELDAALERFANVVRHDLGVELLSLSGSGAAGGMGAGLVAILGAEIVSGAALVCDTVGLNDQLARAGLAITGEGLLDGQTMYNKAPMEVARRAIARGVPVIVIAGALGPGHEAVLEQGITTVEAATPDNMPLDEALSRAYELVCDAAERAVRRWYGQTDPAGLTGRL